MNGTIGEIRGFAGTFNPRAWAFCSGQLLAISQNTALFSILGTIYGGDGRTTFALPDLRGRIPKNVGSNSINTPPGLQPVGLGQRGGQDYTYLYTSEMPSHNHTATLNGVKEDGLSFNPKGRYLAGDTTASVYSKTTPDVTMGTSAITVGNNGAAYPIYLTNPYQGINMIICTEGTYPSRN